MKCAIRILLILFISRVSDAGSMPCAAELGQLALAQAHAFLNDDELECTKISVDLRANSSLEQGRNYKGENIQVVQYRGVLSFLQKQNLVGYQSIRRFQKEVQFQSVATEVSITPEAKVCQFSKIKYAALPLSVSINKNRISLIEQANMISLEKIFTGSIRAPGRHCTNRSIF